MMAPEADARSGRTASKASYAALYRNVRSECKHFYDFLKELLSNSYDAEAATIDLFLHFLTTASAQPLASVLTVCDDGVGMDHLPRTPTENEGLCTPPASSLDAYTQLGHSTNTGEQSIGRFCYGAKQAFNKADGGFMLVTRTKRLAADEVILIDVDDMQNTDALSFATVS